MKRSIALAAVLLLLVALTGCGFGGNMTERVNQTLTVSDAPTIVVDSDGGSIRVFAGASGTVTVDADKRADSQDALDDMNVSISNDNNTVHIAYKRSGGISFGDDRSVDFIVTAPANTTLRLNTAGGSINGTGFAKGLEAHTSGGSIETTDVKGDMTLNTSGGSIEVRGAAGSLDLKTSGGSIKAQGSLVGNNTLRTSGGSILATVPAGSNMSVHASTSGGSVHNAFGLETHDRSFDGSIGDGSKGSLELHTSGGDVTLNRE